MENTNKISKVLRPLGAMSIYACALTSIVSRAGHISHTYEYLLLLAFSALLGGLAFFCGLKLKDAYGARYLLSLIAFMIPVHFSQLGGLLYSAFGKAIQYCPDILRWQATSENETLLALFLTYGILVPLTYFAMMVLSRENAKQLTLVIIGCCSLLLIPNRDPFVVTTLFMLGAIGYGIFRWYSTSAISSKTLEGRLALEVPTLALGLLVTRQVLLYGGSPGLLGGSLILIAFAVSQLRYEITIKPLYSFLLVICALMIFSGWALVLQDLVKNNYLTNQYVILSFGIPFSLLLRLLSIDSRHMERYLKDGASFVLSLTIFLEILKASGFTSSFICLCISMILTVYAAFREKKLTYYLFLAGCCASVAQHLYFIVRQDMLGAWIPLALFGAVSILLSSYLEKNYKNLRGWVSGVNSLRSLE